MRRVEYRKKASEGERKLEQERKGRRAYICVSSKQVTNRAVRQLLKVIVSGLIECRGLNLIQMNDLLSNSYVMIRLGVFRGSEMK